MVKESLFAELRREVGSLVEKHKDSEKLLLNVASLLRSRVDYYDWVGFYKSAEDEEELVLGPFSGEETEHVRIPYGEGICGQSAESERSFVVQDVQKEDNYLACSSKVKSEIVIPIFHDHEFVGEIDIDSHSFGPFDCSDEDFLEDLAGKLSFCF